MRIGLLKKQEIALARHWCVRHASTAEARGRSTVFTVLNGCSDGGGSLQSIQWFGVLQNGR